MMDQRELKSHIALLHKAEKANEPSANIITLLETLKKDAMPTEEMLRTTKAGMVVGKLRGNANKDIARVASQVVTKWRNGVEAEKKARAGGSKGSVSPASKPAPSPASTKPLGASKKPYEGNTETRTYKADKVEIQRTDSQIRDNIIGLMYNGLAYRSSESEENVLQRAIEVESAAFKAYKGETKEYKDKMRSLFQNLKNKQNRELGEKVMAGTITAERFVIMTSKELMSADRRRLDAEFEKENMNSAQVAQPERSISDTLQCPACKQRKVAYTQAQTRSADEPMTTFCHCTVCDKHWKFS